MQNILASYVDIGVVAGLARNPSIPESLMEPLFNCKLREILIGLACNTKLPEHLQVKLIASGDAEVLENIAHNLALTVAQQISAVCLDAVLLEEGVTFIKVEKRSR